MTVRRRTASGLQSEEERVGVESHWITTRREQEVEILRGWFLRRSRKEVRRSSSSSGGAEPGGLDSILGDRVGSWIKLRRGTRRPSCKARRTWECSRGSERWSVSETKS